MKIVPDTNILISGMLWAGLPHQLLRLAEERKVELFSSSDILDEFAEVVARNKFAERLSRLSTTPDEVAMHLYQLVNIVVPIADVKSVIEDEDDLMFLACASEVQADSLISGDTHPLELGS